MDHYLNEILKNEILSSDQVFFKFITQEINEFNSEKEKTNYTKYILTICSNVKNYIFVKCNSTQNSHASEKIEKLISGLINKKNITNKLLEKVEGFSKLFEV